MWERLPGGPASIIVFLCILAAYTVQTESIQYIQHTLGYQKPLFLLFVTHSSFVFLLPIYLGFIHVFTTRSTTQCCSLLLRDIRRQLDFAFGPQDTPRRRASTDVLRLLSILLVLTVALTVPSVSWFLAVPLTSMANITSIYNTFSLWALVFSVYFLQEPWSYLQAVAVLLGVLGVAISAYGGTTQPAIVAGLTGGKVITYALLGDALALVGAISMAAYEIFYKRLTVIPHDESLGSFAPLPSSADDDVTHSQQETEPEGELPFGLHPIAMTTGIGVITFALLWIPLVIIHATGGETLEAPKHVGTFLWIALSVVCGVLFNGCFAILLSLWGPVLASMSCLLTTAIVQLTDVALGIPFSWIGMLGNLIITVSFVCLLPW